MTEQKQEIEYEQLTVKVPKLVMDFLRNIGENPKEWIEACIVENVKAEIEGMTFKEWAEIFGLTKVFWEITKDSQYKPEAEAETETKKKQVMLDKETLDLIEKNKIDVNEAVKQHLERLKAEN